MRCTESILVDLLIGKSAAISAIKISMRLSGIDTSNNAYFIFENIPLRLIIADHFICRVYTVDLIIWRSGRFKSRFDWEKTRIYIRSTLVSDV